MIPTLGMIVEQHVVLPAEATAAVVAQHRGRLRAADVAEDDRGKRHRYGTCFYLIALVGSPAGVDVPLSVA